MFYLSDIDLLPFPFIQKAHNTILIVWSLVQITWPIGMAFVPCEMGERTTGAFDGISDDIEAFDWYAFPIKTQKILPLIMVYAQEPVYYECFGSITCGRFLFKRVSKMQINHKFQHHFSIE